MSFFSFWTTNDLSDPQLKHFKLVEFLTTIKSIYDQRHPDCSAYFKAYCELLN